MRKIVTTLLAVGLVAMASTALAANTVRISQVYGGGGGSSVWTYDYVELFNSGPVPVNIGGWSLQYGSATGTTGFGGSSTNCAFIPTGASIPACGYYLVRCGSSGGTGVLDPWPTGGPDYLSTAGPSIAAGGGKIALCNDSVFPTPCAGNSSGGHIVDVLGFAGTTTACYEGSPIGGLTADAVVVRNGGGMTDTDNNLSDFTVVGTNFVTIHNSSMFNVDCLATPTNNSTWGKIKSMYR
jgi:hypothetical protein